MSYRRGPLGLRLGDGSERFFEMHSRSVSVSSKSERVCGAARTPWRIDDDDVIRSRPIDFDTSTPPSQAFLLLQGSASSATVGRESVAKMAKLRIASRRAAS